jgi:hypothetical protein
MRAFLLSTLADRRSLFQPSGLLADIQPTSQSVRLTPRCRGVALVWSACCLTNSQTVATFVADLISVVVNSEYAAEAMAMAMTSKCGN